METSMCTKSFTVCLPGFDIDSEVIYAQYSVVTEIFEHNSFEQFCTNYVNEKLQHIFIKATLQKEQDAYCDEEIGWVQIDYFNNIIVCDLIEAKHQGLIAYVDDECTIPKGTDQSFHAKIFRHLGKYAHLSKVDSKFQDKEAAGNFTINHYAGDVHYDCSGFVIKNKDIIWRDLVELGEASNMALLGELFPKGESQNFGHKRPITQAAGVVVQDSGARAHEHAWHVLTTLREIHQVERPQARQCVIGWLLALIT
eukprot:214974_1